MKKILFIILSIIFTHAYAQENSPIRPTIIPENAIWDEKSECWIADLKSDEKWIWKKDGKLLLTITKWGESGEFFVKIYDDKWAVEQEGLIDSDFYLNGEYTYYWSNKTIKAKGKYKHGLKIGIWKYWEEDGQLLKEEKYGGGGDLLSRKYHKIPARNKNIPESASWSEDLDKWVSIHNKKVRIWYISGVLFAEGGFGDNVRFGEWTYYSEEGKLSIVENYINDELDGLKQYFDKDSKLEKEEKYEKGKLIWSKDYTKKTN